MAVGRMGGVVVRWGCGIGSVGRGVLSVPPAHCSSRTPLHRSEHLLPAPISAQHCTQCGASLQVPHSCSGPSCQGLCPQNMQHCMSPNGLQSSQPGPSTQPHSHPSTGSFINDRAWKHRCVSHGELRYRAEPPGEPHAHAHAGKALWPPLPFTPPVQCTAPHCKRLPSTTSPYRYECRGCLQAQVVHSTPALLAGMLARGLPCSLG